MSDYKLCNNGHYYSKELSECPYCPKNNQCLNKEKPQNMDKTKIDNGNTSSDDKTKLFDQSGSDKTQIFNQSGNTDLGKTKIYSGDQSSEPVFSQKGQSSGRKLVGWLASFTIHPNGADFRLYEGRNLIGSDSGCDIVVTNDQSVSSKHLTILYRLGSFKFKDELSTNGTFINDEFKEEGTLTDGNTIKIGNTIFKFRAV